MRKLGLIAWAVVALVAAAALLGACGSDDDDGGAGGEFGALPDQQDTSGKRGGKLVVLNASDLDSPDPAVTYYQFGFNVFNAIQRNLYFFPPDEQLTPSPDIADGDPEISEDSKTVTVKLKRGIKFSPPVDREITSADVKYAIERAFSENVPAPYAGAYFGFIEGAPEAQSGPYKEISGIQTPDDQTIVFTLSKPFARQLVGALALPITAPVPKEYAEKFDNENPSTYGTHQVFTGAYMIENDEDGNLVGYEPKKRISMVRNPNWDPETDDRPAYVDAIEIREGNEDTVSAARRVLRGRSAVVGDFSVPPAVLEEASRRYQDQVVLAPSGGTRYVSLNTSKPPFDDINLRKAVIAGSDRDALRLTRGGPQIGDVATHFLPTDFPGFEEAGGTEGFGFDYLASPKGDKDLSAEYFKKAGFESGNAEGTKITVAGDSDAPGDKTLQVFADQLRQMGFDVNVSAHQHEDLVTEVCGSPEQNPNVCVNTGWLKDFNDPLTMFDLTFKGDNIKPENNNNYPELDVDEVDRQMEEAAKVTDPEQRTEAWAEVDRLVMEQAPIVPYVWDKQGNAASADVKAVMNRFVATWDFSYTSLK
jgi:peptide/nickel transport system substrate-binding protein